MVNHSTNINKTNNHFSLHTTEHQKRPQHMTLEIQVPDFGQAQDVVELFLLMGPTLPS
jgi:hypothetical protein